MLVAGCYKDGNAAHRRPSHGDTRHCYGAAEMVYRETILARRGTFQSGSKSGSEYTEARSR